MFRVEYSVADHIFLPRAGRLEPNIDSMSSGNDDDQVLVPRYIFKGFGWVGHSHFFFSFRSGSEIDDSQAAHNEGT